MPLGPGGSGRPSPCPRNSRLITYRATIPKKTVRVVVNAIAMLTYSQHQRISKEAWIIQSTGKPKRVASEAVKQENNV